MILRVCSLFFLILFTLNNLLGQVTLQVVNENNHPLAGAHVVSNADDKNRAQFSVTNFKGWVELNVKKNSIIKVSHVGFYDFIDTLKPSINRTIKLTPNSELINEFVVTATNGKTRSNEHLHQVKIINAETIASKGAITLKDALTNELNLNLSQDQFLGTGLTLNGLGGENIKILIDGVPVIGRLNGNIDLSQINLNNIEQIEIIEGPVSVDYGSNALGGVIHLISKKNIPKSKFVLNSFYESVGNYNIDGLLGLKHKNLNFGVFAGRNFFDGFNPNPFDVRFLLWKPKEQYFGKANVALNLNKSILKISSKVFREIIQSKGSPLAPFNETALDQYFTTYRVDNDFSFTKYINQNQKIEITSAYNLYKRTSQTYFKNLVTLAETENYNHDDEFKLIFSRGIYSFDNNNKFIRFKAGYHFNKEISEGERIESNIQSITDMAIFSTASFSFFNNKSLTFKPGLRYSYNSAFKSPLIPSINIKCNFPKNVIFRASYAKGFRAPSLKELYFVFVDINHNILGNKELKSESGDHFTGSVNLSIKNIHVKISGFHNSIQNQIQSVQKSILSDSQEYQFQNIAAFKSKGGSVNFAKNLKQLSVSVGGSYIGLNQNAEISSFNFIYYHELQSNVSYHFTKFKTKAAVYFKNTGKQPFLYSEFSPSNNSELVKKGFIEAYNSLDASISSSIFNQRLNIVFFAKNLFNITNLNQNGTLNASAHSTNQSLIPSFWGRSFGVKLSYHMSKNK